MDIFIISDTHFHHKNILKFKRLNDALLRPQFASVEEMNEHMIENWNKTIKEKDIIIHVGDLALNVDANTLEILMKRLNGKKYLILGNHDHYIEEYLKHFEAIRATFRTSDKVRQPLFFSHHPAHPNFFDGNKNYLNVHGHIHEKNMNDERYINVSVERCNYTPIHIDDIMDKKYT